LEKSFSIKFYQNPVRVELFHVDIEIDGRTDFEKLVFAFLNFANTPKMGKIFSK
jgi:hypothetical protein